MNHATLTILLVDAGADTEALLDTHLSAAGYSVRWHRVDAPGGLAEALDRGGWDLLISGCESSGLDTPTVLRVVADRDLDLPCIVVSGAASEDAAAAVMRAGARDFLLKSDLSRLVPAIQRELAEAASHAEHRHTRGRLDAQTRLLAQMTDALGEGIIVLSQRGDLILMNPEAERLLGWTARELAGRNLHDTIHFQHADGSPFPRAACPMVRVAEGKERMVSGDDEVFTRKDGSTFPVSYIVTPLIEDGRVIASVTAFEDISARREAEAALRQSRERLRELTSHLNTVRENERSHIARELHDELGQMLTALKMDVAWMRARIDDTRPELRAKVDAMVTLLDETVDSVRRIASSLRPRLLDDLGLAAAIEWMVEGFSRRTGIRCELATSHEDFALDREHATGLFRMLQESLTNVARHAEANLVEISVAQDDCGIALSVRDNGKGMDLKHAAHGGSFGLLGMCERAHSLGGSFHIDSRPGAGTLVEVYLPLARIATEGPA